MRVIFDLMLYDMTNPEKTGRNCVDMYMENEALPNVRDAIIYKGVTYRVDERHFNLDSNALYIKARGVQR